MSFGQLKTSGGNFVSRLGGFGDDPGELLTQQQIQGLTPDQLAAYNQQRSQAQQAGMRELAARLSDAFAGRDVGSLARQREESRFKRQEIERQRAEQLAEKQLEEQLQNALASGDYDTAMSIAARLGRGATVQMLEGKERAKRPQIIEGGRYTVSYDEKGMPVVTANQDVIESELEIAKKEAELARQTRTMPAALITKEDEDFDALQSLDKVGTDIDFFIDALKNKKLDVGFDVDIKSGIANLGTGMQRFLNDEDKEKLANYNAFERWKQRYVNESLRLNKGPQTEGDAIRAMKELEAAKTPDDVIRLLEDLKATTDKSILYTKKDIQRRRTSADVDPYDFSTLNWRIIEE
jgi:hypothetical protein